MKFAKLAFVFLAAFLSGIISLSAQQFHVEKSDVFEEPSSGWNQLLQLKNGNTFFFHKEDKNGIDVTIYDKSRKVVAKKNITSKLWDADRMDEARIKGLYEINGEPVIFLQQSDGDKNSLYRIRLNGADGTILKDEKVASLKGLKYEKVTVANGYSGVNVQKDPASDCYALIILNFDWSSFVQTVKVQHFDGTHTLINEADFRVTGAGFTHVIYNSALVDGNKHVYIVSCGFREKIKPSQQLTFDQDSKFIISKLGANEKAFTSKVMELKVELSNGRSQMLYNRKINKLQLRTISLAETKYKRMSATETRYYLSLISYLDPETLQIEGVKPLVADKVSEYAQNHIDKDYSYSGIPERMIMNKDMTTSILMEERSSGEGRAGLGAIGVSVISDTGGEICGYAIQKSQVMYHNVDNARYMSYDYLSSAKGNYVIFNDLATNTEKDEGDSRHKKVSAVSITNAIGCKLGNNSIDKFYLFGAPQDNSCTFCYTEGTDFSDNFDTYATVIVERNGRDKQARIAWVTFD